MTARRGGILAIARVLIGIIAVVSVSAASYSYWQHKQPQRTSKLLGLQPSPVTAPALFDETANWKVYQNDKYSFILKYPPNLSIDSSSLGFISGSDYYGKRDLNILIDDPKIEPSHEGPMSDLTHTPTWQYDGYNFAIFSGDSAINQLSNYSDDVKDGDKHSPPLQKTYVTVLGHNYQLYYFPPSDVPNTDKLSFWFVSFPLRASTVIVTGNYDQKVLRQILSTFELMQ
jgi:hypothetical protein